MDPDEKLTKLINENFKDYLVEKHLITKAGLNFLPRYVSEFVLGNYLNQETNQEIAISRAKNFVNANYPEQNTSELIKHRLLEDGEIQLLQKYKASINLHDEDYVAKIPIIRETISIDSEWTKQYPAMLTTGMWGLGRIYYNRESDAKHRLALVDFRPFQLGSFDRDEFFSARSKFNLQEWISLLIISLGLNPHNLSNTQQMHILTRLIPMVAKNINLAEFGPKSTGKTYQYRNHSSYCHVISGASVTPAKFAFDLNTNVPGLISTSDVVVFDEITGADFGQKKDFEMIGLLKDYMEGGNVSRGGKSINDDASLVFLGNIETRKSQPKFQDFVTELPLAFADTAFLDRIYGFIPGWEIPKISQTEQGLTTKPGLMSNYLGEAFHNLRTWDHPSFRWSLFDKQLLNIRNEKAVMYLTGGLMKILFPGIEISDEELNFCLKICLKMRQNVYDQLHYQEPDEFEKFELIASV